MITSFDALAIANLLYHLIPANIYLEQSNQMTFSKIHYAIPESLHLFSDDLALIKEQLDFSTKKTSYYRYHHHFCDLLLMDLPSASKVTDWIIVGPFFTSTKPLVEDVITTWSTDTNPLTDEAVEQLLQKIPCFTEEKVEAFATALVNLCQKPLVTPLVKSIDKALISHQEGKNILSSEDLFSTSTKNQQLLEQRYKDQNMILDSITNGNLSQLSVLINGFSNAFLFFQNRVRGNVLRSTKNIGFSLNTMCRMAAEKGMVHPFYLDQLSEKYAVAIEKCQQVEEIQKLLSTIPVDYCQLVIKYSTRHYSFIVQKAVDYIQLHLRNNMKLTDIADVIPVSTSYLSRKFNQEMKMSIPDYINHKRIEEAKTLLINTDMTVTEIAYYVGFNDLNYFIKLFKKELGTSPNHYRQHH